jgi:hypothetical protein
LQAGRTRAAGGSGERHAQDDHAVQDAGKKQRGEKAIANGSRPFAQ